MTDNDLDVMDALTEAFSDISTHLSARDLFDILASLHRNGWQLTRRPDNPELHSEIEPAPIASDQEPQWPPPALHTKLWAIANGMPLWINTPNDLRFCAGRWELVEADNADMAVKIMTINHLPSVTLEHLIFDGIDVKYWSQEIPF